MHIQSEHSCVSACKVVQGFLVSGAVHNRKEELEDRVLRLLQHWLRLERVYAVLDDEPAFLVRTQQVELAGLLLQLQEGLDYQSDEHSQDAEVSEEHEGDEESLPDLALGVSQLQEGRPALAGGHLVQQ